MEAGSPTGVFRVVCCCRGGQLINQVSTWKDIDSRWTQDFHHPWLSRWCAGAWVRVGGARGRRVVGWTPSCFSLLIVVRRLLGLRCGCVGVAGFVGSVWPRRW